MTLAPESNPRNWLRLVTIERWLCIALFIVPFAVPYHWLPVPSFFSSWIAAFLAAMLLVTGGLRARHLRADAVAVPMASLTALALLAVLLVQHFLEMHRYVQVIVLVSAGLLASIVACTAGTRTAESDNETVAREVAVVLIIGALAQCVLGVLQLQRLDLAGAELVELPRNFGFGRVGGLLQQSNSFVAYVAWSLAALAFLDAQHLVRRRLVILLAIGLMTMMSLSGSRSAYLYMFAIAPPLAVAFKNLKTDNWKGVLAAPLLYLLVDWTVRYGLPLVWDSGSELVSLSSGTTRVNLFRDAASLFIQAPWLGHGWGNFAGARYSDPSSSGVELIADHAHNGLLQLLAETGLVGTAAVVLGIGFFMFRALSTKITLTRSFYFTLLAVVGLYSLVEFPLWLLFFLLPTSFLIGALETKVLRIPVSKNVMRLKFASAWLFLLLVMFSFVDYRRVERLYFGHFVAAPADVSPMDTLRISMTTIFRFEAEQLYMRQAPFEPLMLSMDMDVAQRVFQTKPAVEFLSPFLVRLMMVGKMKEAAAQLARYCERDPVNCDDVVRDFDRAALRREAPYEEFMVTYRGHVRTKP